MGIFQYILQGFTKRQDLQQHEAEILAAVDFLVEATYSRIRFLPGYQAQLKQAAWIALQHVNTVTQSVPGPVECSRATWSQTPILRAMFSSADGMRRMFSRSLNLRKCAENHPEFDSASCYAVLTASREVRKGFGVELQGEIIRRDVPQTMVSFSDHRLMIPSASEAELRTSMQRFVLEFLAQQALQQITSQRSRQEDMETTRALLRTRLQMKQQLGCGLACMCKAAQGSDSEVAALCGKLSEVERQLAETVSDVNTLDYCLRELKTVLESPEKHIRLQTSTMHLDSMNLELNPASCDPENQLCMTEIALADQPPRVILLVKFPHSELIDAADLMSDAERLAAQ